MMKLSPDRLRGRFFIFPVALISDATTGLLSISVPVLAYHLGASALELGIIGASFAIIYCFAPAIMGVVSDLFGYRRLMTAALLLRGALCLIYPFTTTPLHLVLVRVLDGLFLSLLWPSLEAFVATLYASNVDSGLKRFNVAWGLGWVVGPLLAGILLTLALKLPFFVASVLNLVLGGICIATLEDPPRVQSTTFGEPHIEIHRLDRLVAAITVFASSFVVGSVLAFFPAQAVSAEISPLDVGMMGLAFGALRAVSFSLMGPTGRGAAGHRRTVSGCLLMSLAMAPFWLQYRGPAYYLGFALLGSGSAIAYSASISLMLKGEGGRKGLRSGLFESSLGLGYLAGPLAGGVTTSVEPAAIYFLNLIVGIVVAFVILLSGLLHSLLLRHNVERDEE